MLWEVSRWVLVSRCLMVSLVNRLSLGRVLRSRSFRGGKSKWRGVRRLGVPLRVGVRHGDALRGGHAAAVKWRASLGSWAFMLWGLSRVALASRRLMVSRVNRLSLGRVLRSRNFMGCDFRCLDVPLCVMGNGSKWCDFQRVEVLLCVGVQRGVALRGGHAAAIEREASLVYSGSRWLMVSRMERGSRMLVPLLRRSRGQ